MNGVEKKTMVLVGIIICYLAFGGFFFYLVDTGKVSRLSPQRPESTGATFYNTSTEYHKSLEDGKSFVRNVLKGREGDVNLYVTQANDSISVLEGGTNSEAMSYYVLWNVMEGNKGEVDASLDFIEEKMLHPELDYLMWKIDDNGTAEGQDTNIASDADLRLVKALFVAEEKWGDEKYSDLIERLERSLRIVALTDDNHLAPYGGATGPDSAWTGQEVWLSYMDFEAVKGLEERFGEPWGEVYANMKNATLGAQIHNGLYNSMLTESRNYGNGIDGSHYSINSLWIMVRSAASGDEDLRESAERSLDFYKDEFRNRGRLLSAYDSSGRPAGSSDPPWVYALVGRAAIDLGDEEFADSLMAKLMEKQVAEKTSPAYGGFLEAYENGSRLGQFTAQESLLTLIKYKHMKEGINMSGDT